MVISMRKLWLIIVVTLLILLIFFISGDSNPSHLKPLSYCPPDAPEMIDALAPNSILSNATRLLDGKVNGPEEVICDETGRLYIANIDGRILTYRPGGEESTFFESAGRPLGMRFDSKGNLISCNTELGLLSIDPAGKSTVLVAKSENFSLIDDLTISSDDIVYFTNATSFDGLESFYYDILLHHPLGSVWSYDLKTDELSNVLDELYFANGVQLSNDENSLLVNETAAYQIRKVWVKGPNKGKHEVFIDNLPGFPDGLDSSEDGNYWISIVSPRKSSVDHIYHPRPWLKKILLYLPKWLRPKPTRIGMILKISPNGEILNSIHDINGEAMYSVTNVFEHENTLYIGSLFNDAVGLLSLPVDGR
jgi:sugar lactone lactonase YvrE